MMVLKEDTHNSAKFLAAQIGQDPEGWLSRIAAFAKIDPDDITKVAIAYQDGSAEGTSKGVDAVLYHVRGQRNIGVLMFDNKKHKFTTKIDKVDNYFDNWGTVDVYPAYPTRKGLLAMSPKERKQLVMWAGMDHDVPARFDGEAHISDLPGVKDEFVVELWMRDRGSYEKFPISYKHISSSTFKTETLWSQYKPTGRERDDKPIVKFLDGLSRKEQVAAIDEIFKLRRKDKVSPAYIAVRFTAKDGITGEVL